MTKDSFLHVLGAAVFCVVFVLATTPWLFMSVANAVFWFTREWAQKNLSVNPTRWSRDKHLEWIWPSVVGVIASYVTHLIA